MTSFDKYKELYQCDFDSSMTDVSATSYSQVQLRQKEQEHKLQKLFEFISIWKDQYHNFCLKFNTYSYKEQRMTVWFTEGLPSRHIPLPNSEFYIDEFFNIILNKSAKFEIQEYKNQYNNLNRNKEYMYTQIPDQNIIISGNKFTIVGKDNNYRLDIKLNAVMICSMIVALSNNYIIYNWYSKKSKFKEFIENVAQSNYFIEFQIDREHNSLLISGSNRSVPIVLMISNFIFMMISGKMLLPKS